MADSCDSVTVPELVGEAAAAVAYRGGHLQIIAAAGSGKTEVVSQRVASLIEDGGSPDAIVAFTFTEKAATELKERIRERVIARIGAEGTDRLGQLQVGTIHAYCFRLLQAWKPKFETYSLVDDNQLVALLYREGGANRLDLARFGTNGAGLFKGIDTFLANVAVVENELLEASDLPDGPFKTTLLMYYEMLERYRLLTYGLQIVRAVDLLDEPDAHAAVTAQVKHLIVDEYQDVNPAQERLIELLAKPLGGADLAVVGDDDQAVYQWRGSDVQNIVTFGDRYEGVEQFRLLENRRSRPGIIDLANSFANTIEGRIPKTMAHHRPAAGPAIQIAAGYTDEMEEAEQLALQIQHLAEQGVPYRSIAILVRGRAAYPRILEALEDHGVPVQPGGRTGLFTQEIADTLGATYAWLSDVDWSAEQYESRNKVTHADLMSRYRSAFSASDTMIDALEAYLRTWKGTASDGKKDIDLLGDLYGMLSLVGVPSWDLQDPSTRNKLGTIARFSSVLADYETVTRRSRADADSPGEQVGGIARGEWFYKNLALLLVNYATGSGNYDDFDGDAGEAVDAVDLGTVHGAKGLAWNFVFLPSLTAKRFPSSKTGSPGTWLIPDDRFDSARYDGTDADERRLFYVALTRARDWLSLSSHLKVTKQAAKPSPYLTAAIEAVEGQGAADLSAAEYASETPETTITYSDLAAYMVCPQSYLLRNRLGLMPPLAAELGYGNAIHHLMRAVAEHTKTSGALPKPREINKLLDTDFYLPFANKPAHKQMREQARELVFSYVNDHQDDLLRTWATERPFELYLDGVVVSGRADVIYDEHDGVIDNLAIVDYKTTTGDTIEPLQLQIYADAGRKEGLAVGAAFVHDMGRGERHHVPIGDADIAQAELTVVETVAALQSGDFEPQPAVGKCGRCDVRKLCSAAKIS